TLPEMMNSDMYLLGALDDDEEPQKSNKDSTENICDKEGRCYPKVFVATNYFQEVLEGQEIPGGLHVKIDFYTGKKHAKLLDPNNNEPSDIIIVDKDGSVNSDPVQSESSEVDVDQDAQALIHHEDSSEVDADQGEQVHIHHEDSLETDSSLPIIPPGHKENLRISHVDNQLFEECISKLINTSQSLHDILSTLDNLEDLVHELDFGIKLARGSGLISVVKLLDNNSNEIKRKAALVIGTAMQNNPLAQDEALKLDLIPYLLDLLSSETDIKVSSRLLYALSSIVRGNKESIQSVKNNQGLSRLAIVYQKLENNEFRAKCALFVTDFIDPNMVTAVHKKFSLFDQPQQHDYVVSPFENAIETCGISMIKSHYSRQCPIQNGFKNWLSNQINRDNDEYLEDYFRLVNQVKIQYGLT
ncbi:9573_t:CDS:2, partial [Dentiscutata erythropus]